jgi:glycosyltransferase involved in cell wall biosynthesis
MRVAIVHDWLTGRRGGETVLEQLLEVWPDADLFSVVDFYPDGDRPGIRGKRATTTFVQRLPFARKRYRAYLPIMPFAIEQFEFRGYDLVLSSSHAVAKGVLTAPGQVHVSYVHTPIRYAWDLREDYLREAGLSRGLRGWVARAVLHYIRHWDRSSAVGVDHIVANSDFVRRRIARCWGRDAQVIHPPVDVEGFSLRRDKEDFYLVAGSMAPYKKVPMLVEAFTAMPARRLVVIGDGPDLARAKEAAGPNVTFLGHQPFDVLRDHLQRCRAFVFGALEDFGIMPLEAQACGTPVIAFGAGGALETVIPIGSVAPTGLFFDQQTAVAVIGAVEAFERERGTFDPDACRTNALRFAAPVFRRRIAEAVAAAIATHRTEGVPRPGPGPDPRGRDVGWLPASRDAAVEIDG